MAYGVKVTLEDKGEFDGVAPKDTSINTEHPSLKVQLGKNPPHFGVQDYTWAADAVAGHNQIITIDHNLGFVPAAIVQVQDPGTGYSVMLPSGAPAFFYHYWTTDTQLVICGHSDAGTATTGEERIFKYYIFSDQAF